MPETPLVPPPAITMGAGLAVLETAESLGLRGARLDWPNDVVVGEAKLAGILVEARGLDPSAPAFVVGVGLNVAQVEFSKELMDERAVTSLALEGVPASPEEALEALVPRLSTRLRAAEGSLEELARDYLRSAELLRTRVRVQTADGELWGRLAGIDLGSGILRIEGAGKCEVELAHVTALTRDVS